MSGGPNFPDLNQPVRELARTDAARLYETETVAGSLARLRSERIGERIIYFYVTDGAGRLVGVVPTRRLLLADPATPIREIMIGRVISIPETSTFGEALRTLTRERFLAVPVVDDGGALKGVIDLGHYADAVVDIERQVESEQLFQLVGVHIEQERQATALGAFRSRFPWLLCNVASGLLAALITGAFTASLQAVVALAFFIPVVLALAESVAIQSLALALQSFQLSALPNVTTGGILRQTTIGSILGSAGGLIVGAVALIWLRLPALAGVVFGGLAMGALIGAMLGFLLPRLIHRWKLDPKVASGPAVLALTDLGTLTAYLGLAAAVL